MEGLRGESEGDSYREGKRRELVRIQPASKRISLSNQGRTMDHLVFAFSLPLLLEIETILSVEARASERIWDEQE